MQLNHLRYFVLAVRLKSMNRAARNLDMNPQTLSAGILALERELGYELLIRSNTGVTPTQNGEIVYAGAQKIIETEDYWLTLGAAKAHTLVALAASNTLMRWIVPAALVHLGKSNPELEVSLHEGYVEEALRTILDKRMVGLITCVNSQKKDAYLGRLSQNDMEALPMGEDRCVVILNKAHPLAHKTSLKKSELRQLRLANNPIAEKFFVYRDLYAWFSTERSLKIPKQENLLHLLTLQEDLATVLPESALKAQRERMWALRSLNVSDYPMPGEIWLIKPRQPSQAQSALIRAVVRAFQAENSAELNESG